MIVTNGNDPIAEAIDRESYEYLSTTWPDLLDAIDIRVKQGAKPERLRRYTQSLVGADREGIALRVEQAARHSRRIQEAA